MGNFSGNANQDRMTGDSFKFVKWLRNLVSRHSEAFTKGSDTF
jgi:hypothetical protein